MNCTDFNNLLDDYCDGELSSELKARCDAHLANCQECATTLNDQENLLADLKAMPVVGPSEGFVERVLHTAVAQNAEHQNKTHHRRGFMVGFTSAVAAALAIWVVVGMSPSAIKGGHKAVEMAQVEPNAEKSSAEKGIPEFSIALNQPRDIQLAFYSSKALNGARITLQVPDHVAVVGYPGQRELAWKTNLAKGNNLLRLPLVANGAQGGELVAHIEYMGKVKTLKVKLAVNA
jgi:hypothetical protein